MLATGTEATICSKSNRAFISKSDKGLFMLVNDVGQVFSAKAKGKLRYHGLKVCVGDEVSYTLTSEAETDALITSVFERKNSLLRPPLANIDELWILVSIADPEVNFCQLDQVICQASLSKIKLRLLLTKADLDSPQHKAKDLLAYFSSAFPSILISTYKAEYQDLLQLLNPASPISISFYSVSEQKTLVAPAYHNMPLFVHQFYISKFLYCCHKLIINPPPVSSVQAF